jgi:Lhr-like helicases
MTIPDAAERWFASRGWSSFSFQREVWKAYRDGESGLIHAATGTGKTYAAWWAPLLEYLDECADADARVRLEAYLPGNSKSITAAESFVDHSAPSSRRRHRKRAVSTGRGSQPSVERRDTNGRYIVR